MYNINVIIYSLDSTAGGEGKVQATLRELHRQWRRKGSKNQNHCTPPPVAKERAMVFIYSLIIKWLFSLQIQKLICYLYHKN